MAKERIAELIATINRLNIAYYEADEPLVSDREFDALMAELIGLEAEHPELLRADSPSRRVGGKPVSGFPQVTHPRPLLSLNNAFNAEELKDFHQRIVKGGVENPQYVVEWKIDGLTVALTYRDGLFVQGATRGDGQIGEDITANLRTVKTVPLSIPYQGLLVCRGEAFLPKKDFMQINMEREEAGERLFANPRNAAAGSLRQLDPAVAAGRSLAVFAYDIVYGEGDLPKTQEETLLFLKEQGFLVNPARIKSGDMDEIIAYIEKSAVDRHGLSYDTDGMVLKLNDFSARELLGYTTKAPRFAIAYKFPPEEKETTLKEIQISLGRTGTLTPLGILEPVFLAGSLLSKVSLHNADYLVEKDIRPGDRVIIHKAGDVIPEIVRSLAEKRQGELAPYEFPRHCPVCGSEAVRYEGEVALRCPNESCPGRIRENIRHFASRGAMDIEGLGPAIVNSLIDAGKIKNVADLYTLEEADIASLPKMGAKSAQNLLSSLEKSKSVGFANVLYALGIRHVGKATARNIADHFGSMAKLLDFVDQAADGSEFAAIEEVGAKIGDSLFQFFHCQENRELVEKLLALGIQMEEIEKEGTLAGETFLFTGTLATMGRQEAADLVSARGGKVLSGVSKNLHYLVAGEKAGSKLAKAEKLGIPILTEAEFLDMLK